MMIRRAVRLLRTHSAVVPVRSLHGKPDATVLQSMPTQNTYRKDAEQYVNVIDQELVKLASERAEVLSEIEDAKHCRYDRLMFGRASGIGRNPVKKKSSQDKTKENQNIDKRGDES